MRELRARLDAMETTQRHTVDVGDISEAESENEAGHEGEVEVEDAVDECLFRAIARIGAREKMDIAMHEGNLDVEELLYWIRALEMIKGSNFAQKFKVLGIASNRTRA